MNNHIKKFLFIRCLFLEAGVKTFMYHEAQVIGNCMDEIIATLRQKLGVRLHRRIVGRSSLVEQRASLLMQIFGLSWLTPFVAAPMLLFCMGLALIPEHAEAAGTTYTATQVGILPVTGSVRVVRAANDSGEFVGTDKGDRGQRGFFKGSGGKKEIAGLPKGSDLSTVFGINNSGQVVGSVNITTGIRAFVSQRESGAVVLDTLPGDTSSAALAINNKGKVAGWSSGSTGVHAVTWSPDGAIKMLPMLPDSNACKALAINDSGDVAGECNTTSGPHAVLWAVGGRVQDLGTLPGDFESTVSSINNNGDIVGSSGNPEVLHHAVLWPKGGAIQDIGTLPNRKSSTALAINNLGEVVGVSVSEGYGGEHAFLWTKQSGMQDLNDLVVSNSGFVLTHATAISSKGVILAIGHDDIPIPVGHAHEGHELPVRIFSLSPVGGQ